MFNKKKCCSCPKTNKEHLKYLNVKNKNGENKYVFFPSIKYIRYKRIYRKKNSKKIYVYYYDEWVTVNDFNKKTKYVMHSHKFPELKESQDIPKQYKEIEDKKGNNIKILLKDRIKGSRNFRLPLYVKKGTNIKYFYLSGYNSNSRGRYIKSNEFIKVRNKIQKKVFSLTKKKPIIDPNTKDTKEYEKLVKLVNKYLKKNNLKITYYIG